VEMEQRPSGAADQSSAGAGQSPPCAYAPALGSSQAINELAASYYASLQQPPSGAWSFSSYRMQAYCEAIFRKLAAESAAASSSPAAAAGVASPTRKRVSDEGGEEQGGAAAAAGSEAAVAVAAAAGPAAAVPAAAAATGTAAAHIG
jgi:hypothetical protein